jgi:hypothetical protein
MMKRFLGSVAAFTGLCVLVLAGTLTTSLGPAASAQSRGNRDDTRKNGSRAESPEGVSPFAAGNLVVYRVGTGVGALSGNAFPVFLDEYTSAAGQAAPVRSIAMPTAVNGTNRRFTASGSSTSEGLISRSLDQKFLLLTGYDTDVGTAAVSGTTSAAVNRVVARVNFAAQVDTSTALTDAYSTGSIRGVTSTQGTDLWLSGTGTAASAGARYTPFGSTTSTQLSSAPTNVRGIGIFAGQLYVTSASGTIQGLATVGTGLPIIGGQTITIAPGFPTAAGPSPYQFFFLNSNTVYVADDRATASGGGIQKWTFSGGNWTLAATLNNGLTAGVQGLTGSQNGLGQAVLYATTTDNKLVSVVDDGTASPGSPFSTLATAAANTIFQGVAFAPLATTAAGVSISGRVMYGERGVRNARVTISGGDLAEPMTVLTGSKGQFAFNDIPAGRSYVVSVSARRFQFSTSSQVIEVNDNVAGVDFFAADGR